MIPMLHRSHFRLSVLVVSLGLVFMSLGVSAQQDTSKRGRKYKSPPPTAHIEVVLVRDIDGKPVENAAVIFHPMEGEKHMGNMELKTNEDGKAIIDVLPIGDTVRMQIIAKGFQTYGGDYKVDKAQLAIAIRLKRPGEQYSIYKDHPVAKDGNKSTDAAKPADPPASETSAPKAQDKPAAQPDAHTDQPQPK
jgi:hypothetical protein